MQIPKVGDLIEIVSMNNDDGTTEEQYAGRIGYVQTIDCAGQLHGTWGSLAVIPEMDEFIIIEGDTGYDYYWAY